MRRVGLDHADQAAAASERVVDHHQIARLENVERQLPARQQQRARQRKHRDHLRQVGGPEIACVHRHRGSPTSAAAGWPDQFPARCLTRTGWTTAACGPSTVASSVGPQASKNCTSCLRAPSSFHLRSRRTISIRLSTASWRRFLAVHRHRQIEPRLMIERIGLDLLLQLVDRADRLGLLGELERGARGGDRRLVALGFRHQGERLLGLRRSRRSPHRRAPARPAPPHWPHPRPGSAHRDRRRAAASPLASAASAVLSRSFSSPPMRSLVRRSMKAVTWRLRQRPHEAVDRLAVDEGEHRRDRLDAQLPRDRRVLVDVHLDELDLALGGPHHLFQHRGELLARPAPLRPEIHQHRLALGFLDHVLHERLGGRVLDGRLRDRRRPGILQHVDHVLVAWRSSGPFRSAAPARPARRPKPQSSQLNGIRADDCNWGQGAAGGAVRDRQDAGRMAGRGQELDQVVAPRSRSSWCCAADDN